MDGDALHSIGDLARRTGLTVKDLSEDERLKVVHEFIDDTSGGLDADPDFVALMRSAMPQLPDDPAHEQVEAWIELAELCQDTDFRAAVWRMAEHQAGQRADGDTTGLHHELTKSVRQEAGKALAAGIESASAEAAPILDSLTALYVETFARADDTELRH
jgi:hypothetical protein